MDYAVVYDLGGTLPAVWFPAAGLVFVALGVVVWRNRKEASWCWHGPFRSRPALRTVFAAFFLGFAILWTTVASVGIVGGHLEARAALRDGTPQVVEGTVRDFHPMAYAGHDTERFSVGSVHWA